MQAAQPPTAKRSSSANYLEALTAEIRILIRAVSGDPDKEITGLQVPYKLNDQAETKLSYPQVVTELAKATPETSSDIMHQIGLLQAVRDTLVRMTRPATGLSIAYTALVSGNERGRDTDSVYELAQRAFGGLGRSAGRHARFVRFLCVLAVLLSVFATWEATKASLGKSLLQTLEPLRALQTVVAADKFKLEARLDNAAVPPPGGTVRTHPVCSPAAPAASPGDPVPAASPDPPWVFSTAEIRDLCGRDLILTRNFVMAHDALKHYHDFWPDLVGGPYAPSAHLLHRLGTWAGVASPLPGEARAGPSGAATEQAGDDVEFQVAPVVQVITSFILPFTFGIIGSLLYVLLQHYNQVRLNLLVPRDFPLAWLRVILGVVVAVCVSLLITGSAGPAAPVQPSPSGSTAPGSLVGSLTLSASLITFLAGFGAEAVFTMLNELVQRVFAMPKA